MESFKADCVIIGAGVVGLATAMEVSKRRSHVVVMEMSSRNSEVIHAGI